MASFEGGGGELLSLALYWPISPVFLGIEAESLFIETIPCDSTLESSFESSCLSKPETHSSVFSSVSGVEFSDDSV